MLRPTTDSVDAKLTPREAVLNRNAAELAGRGNINQLNHMGNMMAQQGIDLPTLHAQQGTEDVNMNNPRYYDEGTGSVQSNLPYDPSYPGPTNPTGAGSGVPTQRGIGLGANILGNLIFPGAGMLTGPLASWITRMMQGNAAQNQVQGAVQGTGQQPTNPVTGGGYGSQPVWGDNPYPGGFDPNASFNYGNPAGPNTQSGIGQLGSSGPGGGFFGSTVPGGNEQNFMPTLGVAMPDAGGGGAYGGNEMAKIAMHGAFHDIATPEQYEYVKQFLSGGGGGGGGGKGVGGGGKPMTQAYAGGTSNVQMGGLGGLQTQPYQNPAQVSMGGMGMGGQVGSKIGQLGMGSQVGQLGMGSQVGQLGMGSQVGQLGMGSQVGQLGGVGGMPDRNFAHPMAGLMHPDMPRNFPHPNAGLMHPGMGGGAPMVAQPAAYGGGQMTTQPAAYGGGQMTTQPAAYGGGQQPAAVGNMWGGGFNAQGVPIAPAGGWNMQNSGYTGNPAEYGTMQSQVGHYAGGTSDVLWNTPFQVQPPILDYPPSVPPPAPVNNPVTEASSKWTKKQLEIVNRIKSGREDFTFGPGSPNPTKEDRETYPGGPRAPASGFAVNHGVALAPSEYNLFTPDQRRELGIMDIAPEDQAGKIERYYGSDSAGSGQASASRYANPTQGSFARVQDGVYSIDPGGDYAKAVAGTSGPSPTGEAIGTIGKSISNAGAHLADVAAQQAQTATSQGLSMIGGIGGNPYSDNALSAYYASLQNPTVFR